jgi:hypothetical protein
MPYLNFNNAAEELSFLATNHDPYRNVREVAIQCFRNGFMRVKGILRDDSNIPVDKPRARVHPLRFDVLVHERISVEELQLVIRQQTQQVA